MLVAIRATNVLRCMMGAVVLTITADFALRFRNHSASAIKTTKSHKCHFQNWPRIQINPILSMKLYSRSRNRNKQPGLPEGAK